MILNEHHSITALDNYLFFVAIVDAGSLTKAAEQLAIPKSKLSRRLTQLERELGSQLITRTTRSQQLTESGRLLYQQCQPHIEALREVEQIVYESQHEIKGSLRLLLPLEFFNRVIGELIASFAEQHPYLSLHLEHYTGLTPDFDLNFDLVFVLHEQGLPASRWIGKTLLSFPQGIYRKRDKSAPKKFTLDKVNEMSAICASNYEQWYFRHGVQTQVVSPNSSIIMSSPEMRVTACQHGLGYAKLPEYIAENEVDLEKVELTAPLIAQQLTLLYQSRNVPAKTKKFLDYFQSKIGCLT